MAYEWVEKQENQIDVDGKYNWDNSVFDYNAVKCESLVFMRSLPNTPHNDNMFGLAVVLF